MVTETQRIEEWLVRVASSVRELKEKLATGMTSEELLEAIRQNYEILSVMRKVSTGSAYMRGINPPKGI
jgi:hypothetical protein